MITAQYPVNLKERSYPVYIGSDLGSGFAPKCIEHGIPKSLVVVTDTHVASLYLRPLLNNLQHAGFTAQAIVIPSGENQKNLRRAGLLYTEFLQRGIGRASALAALGGGVIGDLAGFIAATYQRGIPLVHIPTTLLAQVDSSIGGKVAVNHPLGKNMIGSFYQPKFVWADIAALTTLPFREIVCGMGEVVKYGIIRDKNLFAFLEDHLDAMLRCSREELLFAQSQCIAVKAEVVSQDEFEQNIRIILNAGHTVGHALESAGQYRVLKHGEAVLLGLAAESFIAQKLGILSAESYERIVRLIKRIPLKAKLSSLPLPEIFSALQRDKKRIGKKVRFVLPKSIGTTVVVDEVPGTLIKEAMKRTVSGKYSSVMSHRCR
jgi:3-dehydroquinate synthase